MTPPGTPSYWHPKEEEEEDEKREASCEKKEVVGRITRARSQRNLKPEFDAVANLSVRMSTLSTPSKKLRAGTGLGEGALVGLPAVSPETPAANAEPLPGTRGGARKRSSQQKGKRKASQEEPEPGHSPAHTHKVHNTRRNIALRQPRGVAQGGAQGRARAVEEVVTCVLSSEALVETPDEGPAAVHVEAGHVAGRDGLLNGVSAAALATSAAALATSATAVAPGEPAVAAALTEEQFAKVMVEAVQHLTSVDPLLAEVIGQKGPPKMWRAPDGAFKSLVRSILYQQLHGTAAAAIHKRLLALCGDAEDSLSPAAVLALDPLKMRAVGLSFRKVSYLQDLAAHFGSGQLSDAAIRHMDDAALMQVLTAVKGIGQWSVHMFMMFALLRPDVLPTGDLAIRKGLQKLYGLAAPPKPAEMEALVAKWRPYRSVGCYYLWRLLETKTPADGKLSVQK
eukprot:jgi/Mesen1/8443/ME000475S07707